MAHTGTMVGGSAQTKQSGTPWAAIALTFAVVVAAIAGVWLASSTSLLGGTAKPAADRSYDQIEAQRGAIVLSGDYNAYLDGVLDGAHAAPYAGSAAALDERLNSILDGAHATPYAGDAAKLPLSATSGTFHPGKDANQVMSQSKRDFVGGP
jgi:hypothetical protein